MGIRIACGGLVAADAGSVASAGYEVVKELLARGHEVDLYSKRSYVYPEQLLAHSGFRYVDCSQPWTDSAVIGLKNEYIRWLAGLAANAATARRIAGRMCRVHHDRRYELELFLGQWAFGRIPGVPVISWVQGPPGTDARSVVSQRETIKALCGLKEYGKLRAYSIWRGSIGRPPLRHTDVVICGSDWSAQMLVSRYGVSGDTIRRLPYPIDLELFRPALTATSGRTQTLAWVGRIVPRKRLDLFLGGGAQLIAAGRDVKLTVMGAFPFAAGLQRLLDDFPYPDRLTYLPHAPREEVRTLLQEAAALVQPSEEENFGSSVAEALACGTPVVVGPTNGTGDYILGGGERFADYQVDAVAGAVSTLLDRIDAAPIETRERARRVATDRFSVRSVVDGLEAVIQDVIDRQTEARPLRP